jgi:hypothetical protein
MTHHPSRTSRATDAVLETFEGARVRTHVLTLAHRKTRECLRKEVCDVLVGRGTS